MPVSLMVIDDFLSNVDAMRDALLKVDYPEVNVVKGYPGRNSANRITIPGIEQEISRLVQERLAPKEGAGHAKSRLTLEGEVGAADIHVDDCYWSGILYLNRPKDCQGGTDFFRHRATGMEQATLAPKDLEKLGVTTPAEASEIYNNILANDAHDYDKWEHTMRVPMRYNRLILLRPWLWHTACPGFGDSVENGRLVYLMFFNKI